MSQVATKGDADIRRDIEQELEWEPAVDARRIGVAVVDGIATLTGEVPTYVQKWRAVRAAERVAGARGVVDEIQVMPEHASPDVELAKTVVQALKANALVPADRIQVVVDKGWVTLRGEVTGDYERRAANRVVRELHGVRGISDQLVVRPKVAPTDIKQKIDDMFKRQAAVDASRITVEVSGSEVWLRGTVRSWAERHAAENAAWGAPGITAVHNALTVEPL